MGVDALYEFLASTTITILNKPPMIAKLVMLTLTSLIVAIEACRAGTLSTQEATMLALTEWAFGRD
jgi:hypothetical protein